MSFTLCGFGWTAGSSGGGGTITGANNGLSVAGGVTIQLGGILIQNTVIDFSTFTFGFDNFTTSDSNRYIVALNTSGDVEAFDALSLELRGAIIQDVAGVFTQQLFIGDDNNNLSIDYITRILHDSSEHVSNDWNNRMLYSYTLSQVLSIDYQNRELFDIVGLTAVSWSDRILYDSLEVAIMDWQTASVSGLELKNIGTSFTVSLSNSLLSANRTFEFPDASGTLTVNGFVQGGNSFGALGVLGTNDAFGLSFETNNTEWARFLTTGEFGIGLTNPTAKFQVRGIDTSAATNAFLVQNASPTNMFAVTNAGNVLINGGTGVDGALEVHQISGKNIIMSVYNAGFSRSMFEVFDNGSVAYVGITGRSGAFPTMVVRSQSGDNYGSLQINSLSGSATAQIFSNFGGTAVGTIAVQHIVFLGDTNRGFIFDQEVSGNMRFNLTGTAGASAFLFQSDTAEQIIAGDSAHLLGIGVNPTVKLHVKGNGNNNSTYWFKGQNSSDVILYAFTNGGIIEHYTNTAVGSPVTDGYLQYSEDVTPGNACPHFKTENGDIIKLVKSAAYTPTNVTPTRSFDADSTTLNELADVVGTLIADFQANGQIG